MQNDSLSWLRLMQLADSALPIGTLSHSFGLEMLVAEGVLSVENLADFLRDYLAETGRLEATFCLKARWLTINIDTLSEPDWSTFGEQWLTLNYQLDALKVARESREASTALGRRLLQLTSRLEAKAVFEQALLISKNKQAGSHYCAAFGLVCGVWEIDDRLAVAAFLHQSLVALVSACQRLMRLGQTDASRLIWQMKPAILEATQHAFQSTKFLPVTQMFTPSVEVASMRHPDLSTRLFIS